MIREFKIKDLEKSDGDLVGVKYRCTLFYR